MFIILALINLVSAAESHVVSSYLSNDICHPEISCYEFPGGKRWCCARGQKCCPDEGGCCPLSVPEIDSHPHDKMESYQGTDMSRILVKHQIHIKHREHKNYQNCGDEEGEYMCGEEETCCKVGEYRKCCPLPNGTCCGNRCCPPEFACVSTKHPSCRTLAKRSKQILQVLQTPATENVRKYIICPDDKRLCLDTNTCCLITNDTYGCCPYEDAVCCADLIHCCPPSTVCNIGTETCEPCGRNRLLKRFHSLARVV